MTRGFQLSGSLSLLSGLSSCLAGSALCSAGCEASAARHTPWLRGTRDEGLQAERALSLLSGLSLSPCYRAAH
ncbi:hypothetical protein FOA52_004410 [Chlamydomonas sp. UWO 241]|nr:hypothetical protein FOA52_004410 [Chlamydomonas sp. UWO 241]